MSELRDLQYVFTRLVGQLIHFIYESGYEAQLGEVWRTQEQAWLNSQPPETQLIVRNAGTEKMYPFRIGGTGTQNSNHKNRLAVDIILSKGGIILNNTEDYKRVADYWKTLHPLCRWANDKRKGDVFHFSMEWQGVV